MRIDCLILRGFFIQTITSPTANSLQQQSNQSIFFLPMFTLLRPAANEGGVGWLPALAWSSMVSVSPPSSILSNPSTDPPAPFLLNFAPAPVDESDGLAVRLPPAPTVKIRTIKLFIRMTGRKMGNWSGTKGDEYRMTSAPSDGIGLYGSAGSGRDRVAMMMYCRVWYYS